MTSIWEAADEYEQWLGSQAEREADAYYEGLQQWQDDQEARAQDVLMRQEYEAEMEREADMANLVARVEAGEYDADGATLEDADLDDATRAYFSDEPIE